MSGSKQQYIGKNVFVLFEICAYVRGSLGTCSIVIVSATLVSFSLLTVFFNSLTLKFLLGEEVEAAVVRPYKN